MRSSKKTVMKAAAAFVLLAVILAGLDFLLYPCTFMRNDIHSVTTEAHDDIFMGTSHGKMNIDPDTVGEITGRSGHNLCVGGEYGIDVYYMAKLLTETQKPKRIIYEIDPGYFVSEKEEGNNYLLFYHEFPFSMAKIEYFFDAVLECDLRSAVFPWYEYSLSYEIESLPDTVSKKLGGDYGIEDFKSDTQEYHENGFVERYPVDTTTLPFTEPVLFSEEKVSAQNMEYLERLIDLCKEENIEFVAVTTPIPAVTLNQYPEEYGDAWDYFETFFEEQGVEYMNFNTEYYDLFPHEMINYTYYDGHMNGDAALRFSEILGIMLKDY